MPPTTRFGARSALEAVSTNNNVQIQRCRPLLSVRYPAASYAQTYPICEMRFRLHVYSQGRTNTRAITQTTWMSRNAMKKCVTIRFKCTRHATLIYECFRQQRTEIHLGQTEYINTYYRICTLIHLSMRWFLKSVQIRYLLLRLKLFERTLTFFLYVAKMHIHALNCMLVCLNIFKWTYTIVSWSWWSGWSSNVCRSF